MSSFEFEAHVYAPGSAYSETVRVEVTSSGQYRFEFQNSIRTGFFDALMISARLGNTPRFLDLPDGTRIETHENALIDTAIKTFQPDKPSAAWLHALEGSLKWVVALLVVVVLTGAWVYLKGIPLFAQLVSPLVPDAVRDVASEQTLKQMDDLMLDDTGLYSWEQAHYRELLQTRLQPSLEKPIDLQFRHSDAMGANAFALPDGTVVFTDALINRLTDDEFLAIAAHEMGHVAADHGMRSVISSTSLLVAITLVTGDSEAISELLITAPTLLMQLSYSRELEDEADDYAYSLMLELGIELESFATAMEKIVHEHGLEDGEHSHWGSYLSTHPDPQERIEKFRPQSDGL